MKSINKNAELIISSDFTAWHDNGFLIGFLNSYPDYSTQGMNMGELIENLKELLIDLESGEIPYTVKV